MTYRDGRDYEFENISTVITPELAYVSGVVRRLPAAEPEHLRGVRASRRHRGQRHAGDHYPEVTHVARH